METSSKITRKWMLCTFDSIITCFIFLLYLKHINETAHFRGSATCLFNVASCSFFHPGNFETSKPNKCNIFEGRWVYESKESPYYEAPQCPFFSEQVSCQKNGRPDFNCENWSWEAHDCVIPSFNGRDMLKRFRGKSVIIVGDSLNRNLWESPACLLYSTVLLQESILILAMAPIKSSKLRQSVLSSLHWQGADIMVINTGHWWVHHGKFKAWDLFECKGQLVDELKLESAFEVAMRNWENWMDQNVNLTKTTVFFRSISPEHKGQNGCYNKTQPITDTPHVTHFSESLMEIVDRTLSKMRVPVRYLNITKFSEHRVDAHPSVYAKKEGLGLVKRKLKPPESFYDCSNWCLPELSDTWNGLPYASLVLDHPTDSPVYHIWFL
ncbi:unnamed protein product [Withania somnifera]